MLASAAANSSIEKSEKIGAWINDHAAQAPTSLEIS